MRQELLEKMIENIDCFDFKEEDFYKLEQYMLDEDSESIYEITPLLDQITTYAYAEALCYDFVQEYLKDKESFKKVTTVMKTCFDYMNELINDGNMHPTVVIYKDLLSADYLYSTLMDELGYIVEFMDDREEIEVITDFLCDVDEKIYNNIEVCYTKLKVVLEYAKSYKQMLKLIGISGKQIGMIELLNGTEYISYGYNNVLVKYSSSADAIYSLEFTKVMKNMEDKLEKGIDLDDNIEERLLEASEAYNMYKSCQHEYIKSVYNEAKILRKM